MSSLEGRVAIVTGAASGIGLDLALDLSRRGAAVLVCDVKDPSAAVARITAAGGVAAGQIIDVADEAAVDAGLAACLERFGRLDILVNNAGVLLEDPSLPPSAQPLDTWRRTFDTNVHALVAVTQAFLPLLRRSAAGRIVNVSSILGSQALHADPASPIYDFKVPAYNASKAAVNNWTLSLAYELRATPIKVNTVHPGYVRTDMNAGEGEIDVADGARSSVQMALLGADGPSGSFTHLGQVLPW